MTTAVPEARRYRPRLDGRSVAAVAVAVLVGYVVVSSWTGRPVTFDSVLFTLVVGVTLGSIYSVAAAGLVVTYTTSGVFNFAQGAMGMFCAYVYWSLKVDFGLPTLLALVLTVLVFAPLFGALVERVLMRRLASAPLVAQLVVTIGLMLALMGLAVTIWDPNSVHSIPTFFGISGFNVGQTLVPWYRFIAIVTGVLLAVGIRILLYRTRLGIAMRAVVDQRDLAALNGARPARTSAFAWALGTSMAAIAGIFLAQELATLSVDTLTLFIIDAFAAAIIGRLQSLPLTYAGGMLIGLALAFQQNFLTWTDRWTTAPQAIPTMILFLALLFVPQARLEGRRIAHAVVARVPSLRRASLGMGALLLFVVVNAAIWGRIGERNLTMAVSFALVMLALVPLIGWSGQVSLGQVAFCGIGGFAMYKIAATGEGWWIIPGHAGAWWGLLVGAALAVPFGALMALPALRLRGLYLALATMAFARMVGFLVFDQAEVFGNGARQIPAIRLFGFGLDEPFTILGVSFSQDAGMLIFCTVMLGIVGVILVAVRRSAYGRRLIAMRDSPAASATLGMNILVTKLTVFVLSAAIAGFAGALGAAFLGSAASQDFQVLSMAGLPLVLLAVVGGVSVVSGAVFGGFALQSFNWLVLLFPSSTLLLYWQRIGPGLAGIGIGRDPDGAMVQISASFRGEAPAQLRRKARKAARLEAAGALPGEEPDLEQSVLEQSVLEKSDGKAAP